MTRISAPLPSDQNLSGPTLGIDEIELVSRALESGTLTSTRGTFVKQIEHSFAELMGVEHCYGCSSGTAAVHTAVAAVDPEPGDEVITSPITDMGAVAPILYQGAIPVFADVDPHTLNVTPAAIERVLSDRTRAIIVTHLFGCPCPMGEISALARDHGIPVIEDCAQSFLARHQDELTGTIGDIGCFSLQQGKHITCGEGGLVVCADPDLARRMFLFINKAWGYGDENPDHYFLALNSRMSELHGAVALAQLSKLGSSVDWRIDAAARLTQQWQVCRGSLAPGSEPEMFTLIGATHCGLIAARSRAARKHSAPACSNEESRALRDTSQNRRSSVLSFANNARSARAGIRSRSPAQRRWTTTGAAFPAPWPDWNRCWCGLR